MCGESRGASAQLLVSTVPRRSIPPVILNIAPDRQNVSAGLLRVFVIGTSFCDGTRACGVVKINGVAVSATSWSHAEILVIIPDLPQGAQATVQVVVGGQASNLAPFSKPVPNIDARVTQGSWTAMDTRGGELMWIGGVLDLVGVPPASLTTAVSIGGRPSTMINMTVDNGLRATDPAVSFRLYFLTPAGPEQQGIWGVGECLAHCILAPFARLWPESARGYIAVVGCLAQRQRHPL